MRRPRAKTFRLATVTAASAALAACGLSSAATQNTLLSGPTGTPITIGISEPLGGSAESDPFIADGQACKAGYELWASDVNSHGGLLGRPVRLKFLDDKGSESVTKANYRTLITQDKVDLILAPFSSLLTVAAAPVTNSLHYALVAGSAGAPIVYGLNMYSLFSTNLPVVNQMVPLANWVLNLPPGKRPTTAAYPEIDDPFADPPVDTARGLLEAGNVKTVYAPKQPYDAASTSKQLAADAKAVAQSGAQMVVLGSVDVPTVQAFIKEFIAQHYNPKFFIAAAGPDQGTDFVNAVGPDNATGIMVPNGWYGGFPDALSHLMVQDYIAKYGGTASGINADVAESYSAGQVLAAAVRNTQSLSQQQIIGYLHAHTVQTVLGPVRFDGSGRNTLAVRSAAIFQWQQGGHFVQVLPQGVPGAKRPISKPPWGG